MSIRRAPFFAVAFVLGSVLLGACGRPGYFKNNAEMIKRRSEGAGGGYHRANDPNLLVTYIEATAKENGGKVLGNCEQIKCPSFAPPN